MLIAPQREVERFADLNAEEVSDLFATTQKVSKVVQKHFNASSMTVAIQVRSRGSPESEEPWPLYYRRMEG